MGMPDLVLVALLLAESQGIDSMSVEQLSAALGVSVDVIEKSLDMLEADDLVERGPK